MDYILAACIGALSSILANKSLAVYNDGFRPIFAEYFNGGIDRKGLAATSFAVSFGLIVGFGFTNSIAMGVIIIHTFLLMGDIIGTWCPDNKFGTILSGIIGAVYGILVVAAMTSINSFFQMLPVNFLGSLGSVSTIVVATFAVFPVIAVGYQHGLKKGVITAIITFVTYLLMKKFGVIAIGDAAKISLNPDGMAMLAGTITMIFFGATVKTRASAEEGISNMFSNNVDRIKKSWFLFAIMGGLISAAAASVLLTSDVISGPLAFNGQFTEAALVALVRAIGYIPLVYTTAIVTGVFSPAGSYFVIAVGLFCASFGLSPMMLIAVSFVAGALTVILETFVLGSIGRLLDTFPALREMGDHIRNAMSQILEVALLVGGFIASNSIMAMIGLGYIGSMSVMVTWMLNKTAKKPFLIPLAVGPVVTIAMGILVNVLFLLGFPLVG